MAILVMGVAGSGKSTLGEALAQRLGRPFQDADDLHPASNVAKMAAGTPLTDADRAPWIAAVGAWIADHPDGVIACSALKRAYRERLSPSCLVYLHGEADLIAERLQARRGHFFAADLLASQLGDLEPPGPDERHIAIDCALPTDAQIEAVLAQMRLK